MTIRDNRIKSLTGTYDNDNSVLRRITKHRKPININKYKGITETKENLTFIKSNYITCPECNELIDIRDTLEKKQTKINCVRCGIKDIDLIVELQKHNKLSLLKSAGIPSSKYLTEQNEFNPKDQIIRPSQIKQYYDKDKDTGIKKRIIKEVDKTTSTQLIDRKFIDEYDSMDEHQKEYLKPAINLMKQGVTIKQVLDVNI